MIYMKDIQIEYQNFIKRLKKNYAKSLKEAKKLDITSIYPILNSELNRTYSTFIITGRETENPEVPEMIDLLTDSNLLSPILAISAKEIHRICSNLKSGYYVTESQIEFAKKKSPSILAVLKSLGQSHTMVK